MGGIGLVSEKWSVISDEEIMKMVVIRLTGLEFYDEILDSCRINHWYETNMVKV